MKNINKLLTNLSIYLFSFICLIFISNKAFALSIEIADYSYKHNFTAGDTVTFAATAKNNGPTIANPPGPEYFYLDVVLTNQATGVEIERTSGGVTNLATGGRISLTATWPSTAGTFTIAIRIVGSDDGINESVVTNVFGAYPVRIGSGPATEKLQVSPTTLDFGVLPYGRHMFPIPLEIKWDFFLYNVLGEQRPWYMRIYTDNKTRYKGIQESVYTQSPAGFISSDGKFSMPLRVWCLNYPPEDQEMGWDSALSGPPPVNDDTYWKGPILDTGERFENKAAWLRIPDYSEMTADRGTWRNLIGQDITDTQYATDVNRTGDFTLKSPFSVYFATETSPTSVKGNYSGTLIVEIYSP